MRYLFDRQVAVSRRYANTSAPHFLERIAGWKADLPITNLRGFALLRNDGTWHLVTGRIDLLAFAVEARDVISRTPHSFGFSIFVETEAALPMVETALKEGALRLPGEQPIVLFAHHKTTFMRFRDHFHWNGEDDEQRDIALTIHLDSLPEEVEVAGARLDAELKSSSTPFSSASDLCEKFGLAEKHSDRGYLEICAHGPLTIVRESAVLREGTLSLRVAAAANIDVMNVSVGYAASHSPSSSGLFKYIGRVNGNLEFAAANLEGFKYTVFANYAGANVDRAVIIDPTKHFSAIAGVFEQMDPALEKFRQNLRPGKKKNAAAKNFEAASALLFSMLGFSVLPLYLGVSLDDAPDAIVVTPNQNVAIIECTLADLDSQGKIEKLVRRTKQVRDHLIKNGMEKSLVLPIIMSPLTRDLLTVGMQSAIEHNICVISGEQIDELLALVSKPPGAEKVFEKLKRTTKLR